MAYPDGTVPTDTPVHPTPIYETLFMGLAALVLWRLRDRFRPGILFALYLMVAGFERFMVEFVRRNADVAIGLTQAQLLSVGMILIGAIWIARRRRTRPAPRRRRRRASPERQLDRVSPPSSGITVPVR